MTESDLDKLLARGARRIRFERALSMAFATLGVALLAVAGLVLWMRTHSYVAIDIPIILSMPPLFAIVVLLLVFRFHQIRYKDVALLMDKQASTHEHFVTWLHFRGLDWQYFSSLQREFLVAQRTATLHQMHGLKAGSLIPVRLPEWSRGLLLALLILCCALLMPPWTTNTIQTGELDRLAKMHAGGGMDEHRVSAPPHLPGEAPRVQILSPTQLKKFQLLATDEKLSQAEKSKIEMELRDKIGAIPESELAPALRELLDMLREETGGKKKADGREDGKTGSQQNLAKENSGADGNNGSATPVQNIVPEFFERPFAAQRDSYPDVQTRLDRYYMGQKKQTEIETP